MADKAETSVEERVYRVIKETVYTPDKKLDLSLNQTLQKDIGMDSVDVVSLILALEDEFGGTIEDEEAMKLSTVKNIVDYIEQKQVERAES